MATFGIPADWTPTAEIINALPEPLRRYIHDLQTHVDPAGTIRGELPAAAGECGSQERCEPLANKRIETNLLGLWRKADVARQ